MLHSVLRSIEQKTHMKTLQDLEARVSALVAGTGVTGTGATAPAAPALQVPEVDAAAEMAFEAPVEAPVDAEAVVEAAEAEADSDAVVIVEAADDDAAESAGPVEMEPAEGFGEAASVEPDSAGADLAEPDLGENAMPTAAEDAAPEVADETEMPAEAFAVTAVGSTDADRNGVGSGKGGNGRVDF